MARDGLISIEIEVDGKQVNLASKELDKLDKSGQNSGKGIEKAEKSMDDLADSSSKAGSSVKGTNKAIEELGDNSSQASKDLKGADTAIDGVADSSKEAAKGVDGVSDSFDDMGDSAEDAAKDTKKVKDETKDTGKETEKASGKIKKFATALGLVAIGAAAFAALKASMDTAIARFDTLNKFPKVLDALGVSAEDSQKAMDKLSDGIDGLPTTLNDIASNAQRMYTSFNDMDKAADVAIALNNALLGSGSSAEDAQRGTEQYLQVLQRGKFEMEEWKTLQETMDIGLIKIAESMGYTGKTAKQDLYNALAEGIVTLDQFNDKLIEVGTGTGIMAGLAKENSLGIATSLSNLRNAAAKGIANIINSFNKLSKEITGKDIAQNIDGLKAVVNTSFKIMGNVIEGTAPIIKGFISILKDAKSVANTLSPAIIGLAVAYGSYVVITKATAAIEASNKVLMIAQASKKALTLATYSSMAAQVADTNATKAHIVATAAQTGAVKLSTLATGVFTGAISASTAIKVIATGVTYAFAAAIRFLLGPVGLVISAVGLLVTGVVALVKWLNKETEESRRLNKETEKLGESTNELNDAVEGTSKNYKKNQDEIKATGKANKELARMIDDLSKKENKSASDKALLNSYIEELNGSVQDLNLTYDEEANALNMSSDKLQARIDLMNEQEKAQETQSRLTEILKEQAEVESQLEETNALREDWNQKLEEGSVKSREHKKAIEELDEQEKSLNETTALLAEQQKSAEEQMTQSMAAITEATQKSAENQAIAFDELSEAQQKTVENMKATWEDYKAAATDMFDTLSDKSEISVKEMQSNMEENQRIIGEWAENIATLAERGVDQGLLDTLREAGPESAGHVKALVKASDEELEKLSETFSKGGETATDALSKSLGIEKTGVMDAVGYLVEGTVLSLRQEIEAADFGGVGGDVADGLAGGIEKGTPNVERSSKDMAEKAVHSTEKALSINSPSKVFQKIGGHTTDGMALGVKNGTTKVISTMKRLASSMLTPYDNTSSQFKSIGANAMAGLNQGLWDGSGRVMSTARSIANSVASTMQSALRIHSPSRLMRDDVGKHVTSGLALGIKDNAKLVFDELKYLSSGIMSMGTPEQALGTSRMAYTGGSNIAESLKNLRLPSNPTNDNSTISLLREQNSLLKAILNKNQDLYVSGEKLTNIVNGNNAMEALKPFG